MAQIYKNYKKNEYNERGNMPIEKGGGVTS